AASCRQIVLRWPVLDNDELSKIVHINDDGEHPGLRTTVLRALYDVERGGEGLAEAIEDLQMRATEAIAKGARTLVISDRDSDHTRAPIPSLLAV
ncbi:glutamate synthase central domain-containing protein, partial [Mycobacterium tuberculosis]